MVASLFIADKHTKRPSTFNCARRRMSNQKERSYRIARHELIRTSLRVLIVILESSDLCWSQNPRAKDPFKSTKWNPRTVTDPLASITLTANRPRCVGTDQKATYPSSVKHDEICLRHPLFVTYLREAGVIGSLHNKIGAPSELAAFWPYFGVNDIGTWSKMVPALTSIHFENVQCLFGLQLTLICMFNSSTLWVKNVSELPPTNVILKKGIASALNFQVWHLPLLHSLTHVDGSNISFYL